MNNLFDIFTASILNGIFAIRQLAVVVYEVSLSYVNKVSNFMDVTFFIEANQYLEKWGRLFGVSRNTSSREEHIFQKAFDVQIGTTVAGDNNKVYNVVAVDEDTVTVTPLDEESTEGLTRINDRQSQNFSDTIISSSPYIPIERLDVWRDRIKADVFRQVEDAEGALGEVLELWDGVEPTKDQWLVRALPQNYLFYYDDNPDISRRYFGNTLTYLPSHMWYKDDIFSTGILPLRAGHVYVIVHALRRRRLSDDEYEALTAQIHAIDNRIIPIYFLRPNNVSVFPTQLFMREMNRIEAGYKAYTEQEYVRTIFLQNGSFPTASSINSYSYSLRPVDGDFFNGQFIIVKHNYVTAEIASSRFRFYNSNTGQFVVRVRPDIIHA